MKLEDICKNGLDTEAEKDSYILVCTNGYVHKNFYNKYLKYKRIYKDPTEAFIEFQLFTCWKKTSYKSLPGFPNWVNNLYYYELGKEYSRR